MSRRLLIVRPLAATLCLGAVLALAGCGDATDASHAADADPTTATTSVAASAASEPTWPADCDEHAASAIDYGRAPGGWKTPEEAIAHAAGMSIPAGTIVVAPSESGAPMQVWVVDDATQTILAAVSLASGPSGLYVDGVERCA